MALQQIHDRVRTILYGQGLGEKPAIRLAAADASEDTSSDPLFNFALLTGEGAKVKPGNVLAKYSPSDADEAYVIYVTDVATDTVTGVNGGLIGAPAVVTAGSLDSAVLEQNPLVTSHEIHEAITTIVERFLWPDLYYVETRTVANPDMVDGQEEVGADVVEILHAWQDVGSTLLSIPYTRHPVPADTTLFSTGKMAEFGWFDGSTGYYTVKSKITVTDDDGTPELTYLIAIGAAALLLGGSLVDTTIQGTKKDNAEAVNRRSQVGGLLWRDFLTMKQEYARELGRANETRVIIDRG